MKILNLTDNVAKDVLAVAHSYAGIPVGGAASSLSKGTRLKEGKKRGVIGIAYITAFVVSEGISRLDIFGVEWPPWLIPEQVGRSIHALFLHVAG